MILGICELMQPIAAGYDFNNEKYPRVFNWMQRVKNETQPYFDQAHLFPMKMRATLLQTNRQSKL